VEVISVGHTKFFVKVELTRVQDPGSSPKVFMKAFDQHIEYLL
jgi:hypothetical protein